MPKFLDLTGQTFGRLTVLRRTVNKGKATRWLCRCDCGTTEIPVHAHALRRGHTTSCGCRRSEVTTARNNVHGDASGGHQNLTAEYRAWAEAKRRCYTPSYNRFDLYGGRGIRMCDEWRNDFSAFLRDMGRKASPELSLDRIDPNGNYEPGNCRWATPSEQRKNRRRHHHNHPIP